VGALVLLCGALWAPLGDRAAAQTAMSDPRAAESFSETVYGMWTIRYKTAEEARQQVRELSHIYQKMSVDSHGLEVDADLVGWELTSIEIDESGKSKYFRYRARAVLTARYASKDSRLGREFDDALRLEVTDSLIDYVLGMDRSMDDIIGLLKAIPFTADLEGLSILNHAEALVALRSRLTHARSLLENGQAKHWKKFEDLCDEIYDAVDRLDAVVDNQPLREQLPAFTYAQLAKLPEEVKRQASKAKREAEDIQYHAAIDVLRREDAHNRADWKAGLTKPDTKSSAVGGGKPPSIDEARTASKGGKTPERQRVDLHREPVKPVSLLVAAKRLNARPSPFARQRAEQQRAAIAHALHADHVEELQRQLKQVRSRWERVYLVFSVTGELKWKGCPKGVQKCLVLPSLFTITVDGPIEVYLPKEKAARTHARQVIDNWYQAQDIPTDPSWYKNGRTWREFSGFDEAQSYSEDYRERSKTYRLSSFPHHLISSGELAEIQKQLRERRASR